MDEKVIGIIAGVGPFAGLDLSSKILDQTLAAKDQDHLTIVSLSRPNQIPDRTEFLLGRVPINPAYAIADQLKTLAQMGATLAAIPCNTAHAPAIFDVIIAELRAAGCAINFLHMIKVVADHLRRYHTGIRRIGILSTTGTYQARIYPQMLQPLGFTVVTPEAGMQEQLIHPAVYHPEYGIKARGTVTERARENLLEGISTLKRAGAEAVILGCTEMPLAVKEKQIDGMLMIDPTFILARALIEAANPGKLKPLELVAADSEV